MIMSLTILIDCCCGVVVSRMYEGMRSWVVEPTRVWEGRAPGVAHSISKTSASVAQVHVVRYIRQWYDNTGICTLSSIHQSACLTTG